MSTILAGLSGWFLGEAVAFAAFALTTAVTPPPEPPPAAIASPEQSLLFLHTSGQQGTFMTTDNGFPTH